ncbi:CpsD/CapB family tyrosine-protein kinase [Cohnella sp. GCM10027633]|uniref:CpsD/CapB family tyrosine-protein kinase n=1 Tax=unclassified Cohnella TaxID=2636738 RepID=UPI00362EDD4D
MSVQSDRRFLISHSDPMSPEASLYRGLRTRIENFPGGRERRTIAITSAEPLEGKTTTATNLAIAYAQSGCNTLLIDGNGYRPVLNRLFGIHDDIGLADMVRSNRPLGDAAKETEIPGLSLLAYGAVQMPFQGLAADRLESVLDQAKGAYDIVLIDTPALLSVPDTGVFAASSDGVLLVIHSTLTNRTNALACKKQLEQLGASILGCVHNSAKPMPAKGYRHYTSAR